MFVTQTYKIISQEVKELATFDEGVVRDISILGEVSPDVNCRACVFLNGIVRQVSMLIFTVLIGLGFLGFSFSAHAEERTELPLKPGSVIQQELRVDGAEVKAPDLDAPVLDVPVFSDSVADSQIDSDFMDGAKAVPKAAPKSVERKSVERKSVARKSVARNVIPQANMPNPLKQALRDYRAQRIGLAIVGFEKAAKNKSFIARYLLAHIYRTGKGGVVDHRRAYEYYRQITAEFSNGEAFHTRKAPYVAHAFVQLARYMEVGVSELDIKSDPLLARILFEKAAHFGDIEGQYQLGRFLIESGKMRNVKLGQRWLTRAAMKNNPKAQAYLGALYWQGDLVSRKKSLALAWIEFARRNASGPVKQHVERLYRAVRYDTTTEVQSMAEFYIGRLRSKYHVLWREAPVREGNDNDILDGIILAEPPSDLADEQSHAEAQRHDLPDAMVTGPEGSVGPVDGNPSMGLGYQMFDYGGVTR